MAITLSTTAHRSTDSLRSLAPLHVHPLPAAPTFTGREEELERLKAFWREQGGVLSLVGLGGAGKTALAERFLSWLQEQKPPDGLLVWSFYEEPDANAFLQRAYEYFAGGKTAEAKGAGWFHLLKEALSRGERYLLVLDGLERVQRARTDVSGIYGEMEDPLLRGLLTRLASGCGNTRAIITSRFPVADVERWQGRGYTLLDVDQLTDDAAHALLRAHGVLGDAKKLNRLITRYGKHALTLDLLGGAISRFYSGDPDRAPEIPNAPAEPSEHQSHRLGRVLQAYEDELPAREVALLSRLCIFRFGVDARALEAIFLGSGNDSIAGDMAGMTREQLAADLEELVHLHLTVREGRGKFTIHPAVRDHFYRLFREPEAMHAAVRVHFATLTDRPGIGLPTEKPTLDLLEELIYHAIRAGSDAEAIEIFRYRLGGNDHLNTRLGEYVRTFRILRAFGDDCPDKSAMYHCLRAFGRFDEALKWRPQNRYIRLLNGRLSALTLDPSDTTNRFARFLQGERVAIPDRSPDMPIPAAMLHLYRGSIEEARRVVKAEREVSLYQDDLARVDLMMAEIERRSGRLEACQAHIESASVWILHSGSQEHLCLLHLIRGRAALDSHDFPAARAALDEGLHTSKECDFGLMSIELLVDLARLAVADERPHEAETLAREAIAMAREPACGFAWGQAAAQEVLGDSLARQDRLNESEEAYRNSLQVRNQVGDPGGQATERKLRQIEMQLAGL